MLNRAIILVIITATILVAGCGKIGGDRIVGKWKDTGGKGASEYFADGTVLLTEGELTLSGKWNRLDDGRVKVETSVLGIAVAEVYKVDIRGSVITFTDSKGKVQTWNRAK